MIVLLRGIVGSQAYGLADANSDIDYLGVFAHRTDDLLGLERPTETITKTSPDVAMHEIGKFCRLALGGNPTLNELLWLERHEFYSYFGRELISLRSAFLCAPRVRAAYLGYATQQFKRLNSRGGKSFSADTAKRTAKHARHLYRLLIQGYGLYRSGELRVRLDDSLLSEVKEFGEDVAAGNTTTVADLFADYEAKFNATRSPLSNEPQRNVVDRWLVSVRRGLL